jgi:hypothetical protein
MKTRFFSFYEAVILQRPALTLVITALLLGWLSTHLPNFKLDASADSLVLEGDKDLEYYREIGKRYSTEEFLLVAYRPRQDLFTTQVLSTIEQLRAELAALEGVSSVVTLLDVPLLQSPQMSLDQLASGQALNTLRSHGIDKELVRKELATSPLYQSLLTSVDSKTTAIQVNLVRDERYIELLTARESLRDKRRADSLSAAEEQQLAEAEQVFRDYSVDFNERQGRLVETVRGILDSYRDDADVYLGGVPMIAADMISFVKSDLVVFGSGIVVFIIVTMMVIFRRLTWVALPLLTCLATVLFMLGLITWLDWRMTVISSNFVALLLIITLSITIHLVVRYREFLSTCPHDSQAQLVRKTTAHMLKPCLFTALTTNVAFASLVVSGIRPVIDFGWMMTVGVSVALIMSFVILPCALLLLKKPAAVATGASGVSLTLKFARFTDNHGRWILAGALVLAALSAWGMSILKVENRFIDYFKESTEIYQGMEIIDAELGGTIPLEIIIDAEPFMPVLAVGSNTPVTAKTQALAEEWGEEFGDDFSDEFGDELADPFAGESQQQNRFENSMWFTRAGLARIESVHDYLDGLDETGKVLSLGTVSKMLDILAPGYDDIQLALIQRKLPESIAAIVLDPYLDESIDQARISVRVMETSRSLQRDELLAQIRRHLIDELGFKEENVHLTGMLVLYNNMLQSLFRSQILTLGAVFFGITLMFLVLFRSLSLALIAIAPNLLAASIVLGAMGLAGIPLDIMTVTIAAIVIGIGVDDTIHYVHRFRQEFVNDGNYLATMYRCHGSTGKAMYYTSVIIIMGFSILALSNFNPSIYFGLLTATAMFVALMGALLLLPQLILVFKPLGLERTAA